MAGSRLNRIINLLKSEFNPLTLDVINESKNHHVPDGAETHFKVIIISDEFKEKPIIQRHRQVNSLLSEEFSTGLHALSIHAYTSTEWQERQQAARRSPACRDGFNS